MYFSPKKFLISITLLFSVVTQLIGKWAYTALILYWYPLVTPFNMFSTWEHTVLTAANSFLVPNHFSTFNKRGLAIRMSRAKCLKDRFRTPLGPLTVMTLLLVETVIPSGIFTVWLVTICFMAPKNKKNCYSLLYYHYNCNNLYVRKKWLGLLL